MRDAGRRLARRIGGRSHERRRSGLRRRGDRRGRRGDARGPRRWIAGAAGTSSSGASPPIGWRATTWRSTAAARTPAVVARRDVDAAAVERAGRLTRACDRRSSDDRARTHQEMLDANPFYIQHAGVVARRAASRPQAAATRSSVFDRLGDMPADRAGARKGCITRARDILSRLSSCGSGASGRCS